MFPKENRFKARIKGEFFAKAKKYYSPLFVLYVEKNDNNDSQVAVIVPKKVLAKSTQRSEVKRLLKNFILPFLNDLAGLNVVLYVKSWRKNLNKDQVNQEIITLIQALGASR